MRDSPPRRGRRWRPPPTAVRWPPRPASADRLLVVSAAPASDVATPVLLRSIANAIAVVPDLRRGRSRADRRRACCSAGRVRRRRWPSPRIDTVDRDDRRWLWLAVLCLLALEMLDPARATGGCRAVRSARAGPCRLIAGGRRRDAERSSPTAIAAAVRRARVLALAEAAAWGAGCRRRSRRSPARSSPPRVAALALAIDVARVDRRRARARASGRAQPVRHRRRAARGDARRRSPRSARACLPTPRPARERLDLARRVSDRARRERGAAGRARVGGASMTAHCGAERRRAAGAGRVSRSTAPASAPAGVASARERRDPAAGLHRPRGDDRRRSGAAAGDRRQRARALDRCVRAIASPSSTMAARAPLARGADGRFTDRLHGDQDRLSSP